MIFCEEKRGKVLAFIESLVMCQTFQQGFCITYHLTYCPEYTRREGRVYQKEEYTKQKKGGGDDYCPHLSSWLCEVKDCDCLGHWYVTMLQCMRFGFNKYVCDYSNMGRLSSETEI